MSWLFRLSVEPSEVDLVSSELWDLGTTGLAELPGSQIVAGFETRELADGAARSFGRGTVASYDTSVVPKPEASLVSFGKFTIDLRDTTAFGHGSHPTTRLALAAVSRLVQPDSSVLDMGCGTGVLAIAASLAGARVTAVDNDPIALAAAATNAAANDVELRLLPELDARTYGLVVANMLLADLRGVAGLLAEAVAPGGILATTGFLPEQAKSVEQLFPDLTATHHEAEGDWVLLDLSKPSATSPPKRSDRVRNQTISF